jgi:hypothetical protein
MRGGGLKHLRRPHNVFGLNQNIAPGERIGWRRINHPRPPRDDRGQPTALRA